MKQNNLIDISVVICNYNTSKLLTQVLSSVYKNIAKIPSEVIVVDDNSTDNSVALVKKEFPSVKLIRNKNNLGYSKSWNAGTKVAKGRFILQLNSDISFHEKTDLGQLITYMEKNSKVGIVGCKLVTLDGKLNLTCKHSFPTISNIFYQSIGLTTLFPRSKIFGDYYLTYLDENKIHKVDCLMGAFMFIRREVIDSVGLMDESFFLYGEDIDYCFRTHKAGWELVYFPKIIATHHHGATTRKQKVRNLARFHRAMFIYYKKHIAPTKNILVNGIVYFGIFLRFSFFASYHLLKNALSSLSSFWGA